MTSLLMKNPTYISWQRMKQRCNNNVYYRGRGITYAPEWERFKGFLADMGERPEGTTLERLDNEGDYTKANCRWATPKEQARNRSNNIKHEYQGKDRSVAEIAELTGINRHAFYRGLKRGLSIYRIIQQEQRA